MNISDRDITIGRNDRQGTTIIAGRSTPSLGNDRFGDLQSFIVPPTHTLLNPVGLPIVFVAIRDAVDSILRPFIDITVGDTASTVTPFCRRLNHLRGAEMAVAIMNTPIKPTIPKRMISNMVRFSLPG